MSCKNSVDVVVQGRYDSKIVEFQCGNTDHHGHRVTCDSCLNDPQEMQAIRNNQANISDAYCIFIEDELFVKNLHIAEYSNGGRSNHEPKRARKLLLNRQELGKMIGKVKEKGMSVIPIRLFINDKGKAKLEITLAKGKKIYDKRESIKEKDQKRDIAREQSTRK